MEVCVNHQKQFPGVSPHSLSLIFLCFSLFHPPLSSAGCVSHSSTLISVCSDNEHGGTRGLPTERERWRGAQTDQKEQVDAPRENAQFSWETPCVPLLP